jgi:hypothetical protein
VLVLAFSTSGPLCALCLFTAPISAAATAIPAPDRPAFKIRVFLEEYGLCDSRFPVFVI